MSYLVAVHTDQGITKQSNQDSLCVKEAKTLIGNVIMAVLCDGMGGLEKGEVASASVILAFSEWFTNELPKQILLADYEEDIRLRWNEIIQRENEKIGQFGLEEGIQLGTTVTVLLLVNQKNYMIAHVGDSRVYSLDEIGMEQLTEDHTLVSGEVKAGRMTLKEAEMDPRQNILSQCIGASRQVVPQFIKGDIRENQMFLLCSDGFRHKITSEEIYEMLNPQFVENEEKMKIGITRMTDLNKERNETDNISSILLRTV